MTVALVYDDSMERYRFGAAHPLRPERFSLAVALARAWGLLEPAGPIAQIAPAPATDAALLLAHDPALIDAVRRSSRPGSPGAPGFGIGPGDTPPFEHMHEAAALIAGGTVRAVGLVAQGARLRAFAPAGGLHHAHRTRSAGFCVYNDLVTAIEAAVRAHPGLRIAYIDVDAHHGDGVEEAFWTRSDVLTISIHESGAYLYPGSGASISAGEGRGRGFALNVPLLPGAGIECHRAAFDAVVAPAVRRFAPDLIVAQLGADTHRDDPLAHLDLTVADQCEIAGRIFALSDEVCAGRVVATGGGGYDTFSSVPRFWASALALLARVTPPDPLPGSWLSLAEQAAAAAGRNAFSPPVGRLDEITPPASATDRERALAAARQAVARVQEMSELLGG